MEKETHAHQAIPEHFNDNAGFGALETAITMSADSRTAGQRPGKVSGQISDAPFEQPTIRHCRADMAFPRRRHTRLLGTFGYLLLLLASLWIVPASAVFIDFENCLSEEYRDSDPTELQFVPLYMDAVFNTTAPSHNLQVIVWGNVTGSGPQYVNPTLPAWNSSYWTSNSTEYGGKIINIPEPNLADPKYTTLSNKVNVLTYEPYDHSEEFCASLVNGTCPLAPVFENV